MGALNAEELERGCLHGHEDVARVLVGASRDLEGMFVLGEALLDDPGKLYLGSRDFSSPSVPFLSWWGNRWATAAFGLVHGKWLPDTVFWH